MKSNVAILIPYFGSIPEWFDYFLLTCSKNPSIDWLFFTDCLSSHHQFSNIFFVPMYLDEFNKLASRQLGFDIEIKHPYKICELKPAYGHIFEHYLGNYDYWGYGDIDLVYGDILHFLPENWNAEYDIISNHTEFIPGHLCILKNTHEIKTLYRQADSYQRIFQSKLYHGFDEILHPVKVLPAIPFLNISKAFKLNYHLALSSIMRLIKHTVFYRWRYILRSKNIDNKPIRLKDFSSVVKHSAMNNKLKVRYRLCFNCDLMMYEQKIHNWQIEWNNGTLVNLNTNEDLMYFHFQLSKSFRSFKIHKFNLLSTNFRISKTGIK